MKTRFYIFSFVAMLALSACNVDPVIYRVPGKPEPEGPAPEQESGLKVCSFNIRYYNTDDEYPWSVRKEPVMKFISTVKPDFVGLQELRSTQAQDLSYNLGDTYGLYEVNRDTGNSIMSSSSGEAVGILYRKDRFVIEEKGFFWLAENPDELPQENPDGTFSSWNSACRRVVLWVKAIDKAYSDRTVYFFSTHFDHKSSDARLNSSNLTVSKIKEIAGVSEIASSKSPIFLVADFNCEYNSSELAPLKSSLHYARTDSPVTDDGRTFNGFGETSNSIIDHIFFAGDVTPVKYDVVTDDYGVKYISDHYPVLFECTYSE